MNSKRIVSRSARRIWAALALTLGLAGQVLAEPADTSDRIKPVGKVRVAESEAQARPGSTEAPEPSGAPAVPAQAEAEADAVPATPTAPSQGTVADPSPASAAAAKPTSPPQPRARAANRFNRLMRPPSERNPPPAEDGIHDPENDGTLVLQHPRDAFSGLPKASSGNRVDWVGALDKGQIDPRFDRVDAEKKPIVLDLNIVREVKGSMPDVVYPHKQHTEWLDCSNCHPAIFIPKKGANDISMAAILLGEKCGVCHGKVAFPVSECRKCHSKKKPRAAQN